jgi:hypothetical protein
MFELRKSGMRKSWPICYAIKGAVLVIAAIAWSFAVIGSPAEQRAYRFDDRRVQDLQSIQWQVISSWQQKEKLPATLAEMSNPISSYMVPVDPEFNKGLTYEYKATGAMSFELCATFSAVMPQGWRDGGYYGGGVMPMMDRDIAVSSYPGPGGAGDSWVHEAGRTCFERTIDRDIYPPYPKAEPMMKL